VDGVEPKQDLLMTAPSKLHSVVRYIRISGDMPNYLVGRGSLLFEKFFVKGDFHEKYTDFVIDDLVVHKSHDFCSRSGGGFRIIERYCS